MNKESSMKPNICPKVGSMGGGLGVEPVGGGSFTPTINSRFAPRCIAGLNGEVWRMAPSPKYASCSQTGRNKKGMARLAIKCSKLSEARMPLRATRSHGNTCDPAV